MSFYDSYAVSAVAANTPEQPRLLVVDDEVTSAKALQLYLESQGYAVKTTYSGKRALEEIDTFQPHLLILDLMIPDLSGLDVIIHLRQDATRSYIPVIMITAQDAERKRLQSMISGADDYLEKPVNELELLVRVQALLRTKNHIDRLWAENHHLLRDLEARNRELERALKDVEEANILKASILQTVSHEMGTPMLQIKTAAYLIVEDVRKTDPANVPAKLVTQAIVRLEGIISNLVDLARSDTMKLEPFFLSDSIDLAVRGIERSWAGKIEEGRIVRELEPNLPLVEGDRRAVARVLTLLLDNALKFDPGEKPILVCAKKQGKEAVRVIVKDQGIGIAPDKIDDIFTEFYQIDSSTTRRFGGSGVGLALAKLLCDEMGTQIEVESRLKKGSTFSFLLPVAAF